MLRCQHYEGQAVETRRGFHQNVFIFADVNVAFRSQGETGHHFDFHGSSFRIASSLSLTNTNQGMIDKLPVQRVLT